MGIVKKLNLTLALTAVILIGVAALAYYLALKPSPPSATSTTTTTTPLQPKLQVSSVVFDKWVITEDREVCWRFNITGEVDLRREVEVNGVYAYWIGRIVVTLPNGDRAMVFQPPDYTTDVSQFSLLTGTRTLDACVLDLDAWWERSPLEGTYRVTILLVGPYENRTVLFDGNFTHEAGIQAYVSPSIWESWSQSLTIHVSNQGTVPLILQTVGFTDPSTGTSLGFVQLNETVIMPGESESALGLAQVFDSTRENYNGAQLVVAFRLEFAGLAQPYEVLTTVQFPRD